MNPMEAAAIAQRAHSGQLYGDKPYVAGHVQEVVRRVQNAGAGPDAIVVAWLHDVLEDTPVQMHQLAEQGLTVPQQAALRALTRQQGEGYGDYLKRVMANRLALTVKVHDLQANLAAEHTLPDRLKARYERALELVTGALLAPEPRAGRAFNAEAMFHDPRRVPR